MLKKVYLKEDAFHSRTAQKLIDEEDSYFELGLENRSITSLNFSIMQLEQLKCQIFGFIQHIKKKPMPPTIYQRITEPYPYHLQSSLILNRLFENIPWNQKNVFPPDPWLLTLFHSNLKDSKPTFRLSNLLSIRAKPIISETNIQQHHELLLKCIKNHTSEFFSAFPRTAGSKSDLNMPLLYQYQGMILDGVSFSLQSHSLCFPQIFSDRCSKLRKNHPSYQEKYEKNENFLDMRMGPGPILDISLILSHSSIVKKHNLLRNSFNRETRRYTKLFLNFYSFQIRSKSYFDKRNVGKHFKNLANKNEERKAKKILNFLKVLMIFLKSPHSNARNKIFSTSFPLVNDDRLFFSELRPKQGFFWKESACEKVNIQPKILVGVTLKNYQLRDLEWLISLYNSGINGILSINDILVKNILTIAFISALVETKHEIGPFLVIVPLSTIRIWAYKFKTLKPSLKIKLLDASFTKEGVSSFPALLLRQNIFLTTFEYIAEDEGLLSPVKWLYLIVDLCHSSPIRKEQILSKLCKLYDSRYRLILTEVPIKGYWSELWSLFDFILPNISKCLVSFNNWYSNNLGVTSDEGIDSISKDENDLISFTLFQALKPFLLIQLKDEEYSELIDKEKILIKPKFCQLKVSLKNTKSKDLNDKLPIPEDFNFLEIRDSKTNKIKASNSNGCESNYQKIEIDLFTFSKYRYKSFNENQNFEVFDEFLSKLLQTGHRLFIIFQTIQSLKFISRYLTLKNVFHVCTDLSTTNRKIEALQRLLNLPCSPCKFFLISSNIPSNHSHFWFPGLPMIFDAFAVSIDENDLSCRKMLMSIFKTLHPKCFCIIKPASESENKSTFCQKKYMKFVSQDDCILSCRKEISEIERCQKVKDHPKNLLHSFDLCETWLSHESFHSILAIIDKNCSMNAISFKKVEGEVRHIPWRCDLTSKFKIESQLQHLLQTDKNGPQKIGHISQLFSKCDSISQSLQKNEIMEFVCETQLSSIFTTNLYLKKSSLFSFKRKLIPLVIESKGPKRRKT